jgi:peptidoglycan/LPS O-acetylase OafA/YrhL
MLVVNGINTVQSFFVIGGFLTSFLFLVHVEKEKASSWTLVLKAALLRYIRFAPLLLLTILMHSTWLYRVGSGPLWDKVNFAERQFCRQNWWINMLFLDNYINVENKCLIHRFINFFRWKL